MAVFVSGSFESCYACAGEPPPPAGPDDEERQCLAMRDALLERYRKDVKLPPNFLDQIIHELGGQSAVAEMTGRKGRIVADANGR